MPFHLGIEGIVILGLGLGCMALQSGLARSVDHRSLVYLAIWLILFVGLSINPSKNFLVGIVAYLPLWLFAWTMLASLGVKLLDHPRQQKRLKFGLAGYGSVVVCLALVAFQLWPSYFQKTGVINRASIQQIGQDLRPFLPKPWDCFVQSDFYLFSFASAYYLMDANTGWRQPLAWPGDTGVSMDTYVKKTIPKCNAVLVYEEGIRAFHNLVSPPGVNFYPQITEEFFKAAKRYVQSPASGFKLFKTYPVAIRTDIRLSAPQPRSLTLKMYVKDSQLPQPKG
ncbi:MAG: hypothetical protein NW220_19825 [Leptolyngbyaceae cyanobacterium bins.349]|nr:hypothetical protein [Leptolyngbyaceae cyanobacterium bins.349]